MKDIHTILSVPLYPTIPPPVWTDGIIFLFGCPNRRAGQANGPTVAPVSLCVPSLGSGQPTPPPKESRPNLGGFPRPWTVGQWDPRGNPAKRFRRGEADSPCQGEMSRRDRGDRGKQRNERVFALLGGNEGYAACDDEKQEKGEGSQAPPLRPQMPAVRAFLQGSNRAL